MDLPDKPQVGFIAQEVNRVVPEAVTISGGKEAIMSIQESKIVPVLVEAVKEFEVINQQQSVAITELQRQVAELRRSSEHEVASGEDGLLRRVAVAFGWR